MAFREVTHAFLSFGIRRLFQGSSTYQDRQTSCSDEACTDITDRSSSAGPVGAHRPEVSGCGASGLGGRTRNSEMVSCHSLSKHNKQSFRFRAQSISLTTMQKIMGCSNFFFGDIFKFLLFFCYRIKFFFFFLKKGFNL